MPSEGIPPKSINRIISGFQRTLGLIRQKYIVPFICLLSFILSVTHVQLSSSYTSVASYDLIIHNYFIPIFFWNEIPICGCCFLDFDSQFCFAVSELFSVCVINDIKVKTQKVDLCISNKLMILSVSGNGFQIIVVIYCVL